MSSDIEKVIDDVAPMLGKEGAKALGDALSDLKGKTNNEVGQQLLGWIESTVRANGPAAVVAMKDWMVEAAKGEGAPPFPDPAPPLRIQSDMLAKLQNAEADDKNKFRDQMVLIGDSLGSVLLGVVSSLKV